MEQSYSYSPRRWSRGGKPVVHKRFCIINIYRKLNDNAHGVSSQVSHVAPSLYQVGSKYSHKRKHPLRRIESPTVTSCLISMVFIVINLFILLLEHITEKLSKTNNKAIY